MPENWDDSYDLVIVGSGGGGTVAALTASEAGLRPLIVEKTDKVGGSTALSGGVMWVPCNPVLPRVGVRDTYDLAKTYLDACVGDSAPPFSEAKRDTYLKRGAEAISFLEKQGIPFVFPEGYCDYHENEKPGGNARGRSIVADIFNANELGEWEKHLRARPVNFPVLMHEVADVTISGRDWKSKLTMMKIGLRVTQNKWGRLLVGMGRAFQGRMLQQLLRRNVTIWREAPAVDLVMDSGRVTGVVVNRQGRTVRVQAARGVLIDAGGFAHNLAMRQKYGPNPASVSWTNANPGDTGEMTEILIRLGAGTANMDQAVWNTVSLLPDGSRGIHPGDMAKPHSIMVDAEGQRYVNEATSYMAVGQAMYKRHQDTGAAVPSWIILESRHRKQYRWAGYPAGEPPAAWLSSGYMKKADTLEGLAKLCGIDAQGLKTTVERFNGFARSGDDKDFNRGKSAYNRFWGDRTNKPNASLGPIEQPPFYAVTVYPGDVGTFGGVLTDEYARVLRADGSVIDGLYATGNVTASLTGKSYPGAGASIGPTVVFGYIAAQHAAQHSVQTGENRSPGLHTAPCHNAEVEKT